MVKKQLASYFKAKGELVKRRIHREVGHWTLGTGHYEYKNQMTSVE